MVNKNCHLVLFDLYFYDFSSCYPRILKNLGYTLDVDLSNKEKRNIYIGKLQRNNPELSGFLQNTVQSLLDYYQSQNNLNDDDIIISQTDGFITTRQLTDTTSYMDLDYRGQIDFLIMTLDRKKFLYCLDNAVYVKGIVNLYDQLWCIYDRFKFLNFFNSTLLYKQMDRIKDMVVFGQNKEFYQIPIDSQKFALQMLNGQRVLQYGVDFDIKNLYRWKYFDHYFREFLQSIVFEVN